MPVSNLKRIGPVAVFIEPGALIRGARARVVVGLFVDEDTTLHSVPPRVSRTRLLLHRIDGRWRIAGAGEPIALGTWRPGSAAPDPVPAGAAAALRRLADDELLALSGMRSLAALVRHLARGPLGWALEARKAVAQPPSSTS